MRRPPQSSFSKGIQRLSSNSWLEKLNEAVVEGQSKSSLLVPDDKQRNPRSRKAQEPYEHPVDRWSRATPQIDLPPASSFSMSQEQRDDTARSNMAAAILASFASSGRKSRLSVSTACKKAKFTTAMKADEPVELDLVGGSDSAGTEQESEEDDPEISSIDGDVVRRADQEVGDMALAQQLQDELFEEVDEAASMRLTIEGRAFRFVEAVLKLQQESNIAPPPRCRMGNFVKCGWREFETVAEDDMVFMAQRMMERQQELLEQQSQQSQDSMCSMTTRVDGDSYSSKFESTVDIGYHYTRAENMDRIRSDGLLSRPERERRGVKPARYNGSTYGEGIYTANNPYAYSGFGDTGIFVARLRGKVSSNRRDEDCHTILGNGDGRNQVVLLRQSSQCIPLVRFDRSIINTTKDDGPGNLAVHGYHTELQKIVDEYFNNNVETVVTRLLPKSSSTANNNGVAAAPWNPAYAAAASAAMASVAAATTTTNASCPTAATAFRHTSAAASGLTTTGGGVSSLVTATTTTTARTTTGPTTAFATNVTTTAANYHRSHHRSTVCNNVGAVLSGCVNWIRQRLPCCCIMGFITALWICFLVIQEEVSSAGENERDR